MRLYIYLQNAFNRALWGAALTFLVIVGSLQGEARAEQRPAVRASKDADQVRVTILLPAEARPIRKVALQRSADRGAYRAIAQFERPARVSELTDSPGSFTTVRYRIVARSKGKILRATSTLVRLSEDTPVPPSAEPPQTDQPSSDPPPPLATGHSWCPPELTDRMLVRLNEHRAAQGVPPLATNPLLVYSARLHSALMASNSDLNHDNWLQEILDTGLQRTHYAQNVACYIQSPEEAVDALMTSPGHRSNILDTENTQVGLGCVHDSGGGPWWTQNFSN